jgi:hypothetical protein
MTWSEYPDERNERAIHALTADKLRAKETVDQKLRGALRAGQAFVALSTSAEVNQLPQAVQTPPSC